MNNEDWNVMMTLDALTSKAFALDIYMTGRTFTEEQRACLEKVIGRLTAIAVKQSEIPMKRKTRVDAL